MNIYQQISTCFVYKWTQLSTGKWYIGSHTSRTAHPNDGYLCTSKIVKPLILENRNDWIRVILETGDAKDMLHLEYDLLTCLDAAKSEYSYNRCNGGKFSFSGNSHLLETNAKISLTSKGKSKSASHRSNISKSQIDRVFPNEHKTKLSKSWKPSSQVTCPHCNKTGAKRLMVRYHFDNCKIT